MYKVKAIRAIIPAAGKGKRLQKISGDMPKADQKPTDIGSSPKRKASPLRTMVEGQQSTSQLQVQPTQDPDPIETERDPRSMAYEEDARNMRVR